MAQGNVINLECRSCGGAVDLSADGLFATCRYCGSKQMLQPSMSLFERLQDFPNSTFNVRHIIPKITPSDAREKLISEIRGDPIGLKEPEALEFGLEAGFLPIWIIEARVHSTWSGQYSEERTVTKYKSVMRTRSVGKSTEIYTEQVPYNDTETFWIPTHGTHDFSHAFFRDANAALGPDANRMLALFAQDLTSSTAGLPSPLEGFAFSPPVFTEREAWSDSQDCVAAWGREECAGQAERMDRVSSTLTGADFALIYVPFAIASYTADGRSRKHIYELITGGYCGDSIPLDHAAVDSGALRTLAQEARMAQWDIDTTIRRGTEEIANIRREEMHLSRVWLGVFLAVSVFLSIEAFSGRLPYTTALLAGASVSLILTIYYYAKGGKAADAAKTRIEAALPKGTPWKDFVATRRVELLRLARLACDVAEPESGKVEGFGVLDDVLDFQLRNERFKRLRDLEGESLDSIRNAELVANYLATSNAEPPVITALGVPKSSRARATISRDDRKVLRIFFILLVAGLGVAATVDYMLRTPSKAAVSKAFNSQMEPSNFKVLKLTTTIMESGPDQAAALLHAVLQTKEPLYAPVPVGDFLLKQLPGEHDVRERINRVLTASDGSDVLAAAGLPASQTEPSTGITILTMATPSGKKVDFEGRMTCERRNGEWVFSELEGVSNLPTNLGDRRERFKGDVIIEGDREGDIRLNRLVASEKELVDRLEAARIAYDRGEEDRRIKKEAARRAAAKQAFLGSFAAGSLFKGRTSSGNSAPQTVYLEIGGQTSGLGSIEARLYDGGMEKSRAFTGNLHYVGESEGGTLVLLGRPDDVLPDSGGILGSKEVAEVRLSAAPSGTHLEGNAPSAPFGLSLDRLGDDAAAKEKAGLAEVIKELPLVVARGIEAIRASDANGAAEALRTAMALNAASPSTMRLKRDYEEMRFRRELSEALASVQSDAFSSAMDAVIQALSIRPGDAGASQAKDILGELTSLPRAANFNPDAALNAAATGKRGWYNGDNIMFVTSITGYEMQGSTDGNPVVLYAERIVPFGSSCTYCIDLRDPRSRSATLRNPPPIGSTVLVFGQGYRVDLHPVRSNRQSAANNRTLFKLGIVANRSGGSAIPQIWTTALKIVPSDFVSAKKAELESIISKRVSSQGK